MSCNFCKRELGAYEEKLEDKNGIQTYCPNCMTMLVAKQELKLENDPNLTDDVTGEKGAIKFTSGDETYILEKVRMLRLLSFDLNADEYFALAKKYGAHQFHLHDDFYDSVSGEAEQPLRLCDVIDD